MNIIKKLSNTAFLILILFLLSSCALMQNILHSGSGPTYSTAELSDGLYSLPRNGNDLIGMMKTINAYQGESISDIAFRYDVGYTELLDANPGLGRNTVRSDRELVIPTQYILPPRQYRHGIVINIAEMRVYYFPKNDNVVYTFPIALGKSGWRTPLGRTYIVRKEEAPEWNVPKSIQKYTLEKYGRQLPDIVPPGPENPLGDYALYLAMHGFVMHGTNDYTTIGKMVSSGCIRLYNRDITTLYDDVKPRTTVNIIYYPTKAGWQNGRLYLESHKRISHEEGMYESSMLPVRAIIQNASYGQTANINWPQIDAVVRRHSGIPTVVG